MKKALFTILVIMLAFTMNARNISKQEALQKAQRFMPNKQFCEASARARSNAPVSTSNYNSIYIFNAVGDEGFVVVSADDRTEPILGYSDEGRIDFENMPDNFRYWLEGYEEGASSWSQDNDTYPIIHPDYPDIEPLLETKWWQGPPFDLMCPVINGHCCPPGCVPVAVGQIMYYYKWPQDPVVALPAYGSNPEIPAMPSTSFAWDKIIPSYGLDDTPEEELAVAEMMRYIGHAFHANYNPGGTGCNIDYTVSSMKEIFHYSNSIKIISRMLHSREEWEDLIYQELNELRPVLMGGGGHAYVCDGYQQGYFHMNFGGGIGYFLMDANEYSNGLRATISIQPPYEGETTGISEEDGLRASEQLEFRIDGCSSSIQFYRVSNDEDFEFDIYPRIVEYGTNFPYQAELGLAIYHDNQLYQIVRGERKEYTDPHPVPGVTDRQCWLFHFGANYPDGDYYLALVGRKNEGCNWKNLHAWFNVTINQTNMTLISGSEQQQIDSEFNISNNLIVNSVQFDEHPISGKSCKVRINVTNVGSYYSIPLLLWIGKEGVSGGYVNVNPGQSTEVESMFICDSVGLQNFSISLYGGNGGFCENIYKGSIDFLSQKDHSFVIAKDYTRAYGEENPTFEYQTCGIAIDGTPEIECEATSSSPVGTYPIVVRKGSLTSDDAVLINGTLTIRRAPLQVATGTYTKQEGEENPEFTLNYEGFKNGETEAVLSKQPVVETTATTASAPGRYPITISGAEASNYYISSYIKGELRISPLNPDEFEGIIFADNLVEELCVENWDTNCDGKLSMQEAAAVTNIGTIFKGKQIESFDEFQYFTGLTAIKNEAFSGCKMKSVIIPNSVTSIGNFAFSGCDRLKSITIPQSVTTMGYNPFYRCLNLTSIQVENGNPAFDSRNGCNAIINSKTNELVTGTKAIPNDVKTIGKYALSTCFELKTIDIPSTVTKIMPWAFERRNSLTSITFPSSITSIEQRAFRQCSKLKEVHSRIAQPFAINENVFEVTDVFTNAILYVPIGTKELYEATDGWKEFQIIIEEDEPVNPSDCEPYAVYTEEEVDGKTQGTLTFFYDENKNSRGGYSVGPFSYNDVRWGGHVADITNVVFDASFVSCTSLTDLAYWFYECKKLTAIEGIENLNTENVTDLYRMFFNCSSLTSLDLSQLNTSKVTDMSWMFYNCSGLKTIYAGDKWSTAGVISSSYMFAGCYHLVGGNGTLYDYKHTDHTYARIDMEGEPGYFTPQNAIATMIGDANNDGEINAIDFNMIGNYILGNHSQANFSFRAADFNNDGDVNAIDFNMVGNYILYGSSAPSSRATRKEETLDPQ